MKLSAPQRAALNMMPFCVTMWGGKAHGGWPGNFTAKSVDGLVRRGLATMHKVGNFEYEYRATEDARQLLST